MRSMADIGLSKCSRRLCSCAALCAVTAAGVWTAGCNENRAEGVRQGERAEVGDAVSLSELRERAIEMLTLGAASDWAEERANSLEALSLAPSRAEPLVRAALGDENVGVRAVAAMIVGRKRLTELAPYVEPLLDDGAAIVRSSAIYAMRRCGYDADPTLLGRMLTGSRDARQRAHAAFLLGELGDRSALPMLRDAARDPMTRASQAEARLLRLQIAEARVKLGEDEAMHEIRAALYPARPEELEATALAAQIIGQVDDRGSIDQLIYLTARQDDRRRFMPAEVRLAAAGALAELGLRQGSFIAEEFVSSDRATLRAQAAYVFGQTGKPENLPVLKRLLDDDELIVRISAAAAVLKISEEVSAGASR